MAPRQTITPAIMEKAAASLEALAEREPPRSQRVTASDFVRDHASEIKALLRKGYTASDIAESLKKSGISITSSTLKRALSVTHKKRKVKRIPAHTTTQSNPNSTTEEHNAARTTTRRTDHKKFVDDDIPEDL